MNAVLPDRVALGLAILHFLWQGTLVALAVAVALAFTRRRSPEVRYVLATLGLGTCLALFVGTCFLQHQRSPLRGVTPLAAEWPPLSRNTVKREASAGQASTPNVATPVSELPSSVPADPFLRWMPLLAQGWFLGAVLMALRLGGGYAYIATQIRRSAAPPAALQELWTRLFSGFRNVQPPGVRVIEGLRSPLVVGWIRPMLLVPVGLLGVMDPLALEAILSHELAHIRRRDPLVNALQGVVEVLLFFHPAVWWISRRVRRERELCCDDQAARWCGDPLRVAEALTQLNAFARVVPSTALGAAGGDLRQRILRLLPGRPARMAPLWTPLLTLTLLLGAALGGRILHGRSSNVMDPDGFALPPMGQEEYVWALDPREGPDTRMLAHAGILPWGMGTPQRIVDAAPYRGQRVRFQGRVRQAGLQRFGGLFMRIDGAEATLAMDTRFVKEGGAPKEFSVVLDVPESARTISAGLVMAGRGRMWLAAPRLEVVGKEIPSTDQGHLPGGIPWMIAGSNPQDMTCIWDQAEHCQGKPVLRLDSLIPQSGGFATLTASQSAAPHRGRRVRLSAWMRGQDLERRGALWLRVDDATSKSLAFDNMTNRPLKGTFPWRKVDIVLEVPTAASRLAFGTLIEGPGRIWMTDPVLEDVDSSVPLTRS
ncbi:MAG: M56 family metallopeptidase [Holophaga sp.]|nr:M56 family metallopeptidase [Holophaga sp.]